MNDKFKETFREEADELLANLESTLLELESRPEDAELINAAFRAIHTIKGSAGMFGFDKAGRFAHDLENLLDACRSGKRAVDSTIVDLSLRARDKIRAMLAEEGASDSFDEESLALMDEFRAAASVMAGLEPPPGSASPSRTDASRAVEAQPEPAASPAPRGGENTYRIRFEPAADIFLNGTKVLRLFDELAGMGQLSCMPAVSGIPPLESLDPEACYVSWDAMITTDKGMDAIKDVFIFVADSCTLRVEEVEAGQPGSPGVKKLGEILLDRGVVKPEDLSEALQSQTRLGEVLVKRGTVTAGQLESALVEQEHLKRVQERQGEGAAASIRVSSEKLDTLIDLVGELVTMQARLAITAQQLADAGLSSISEQFDRLVAQLRDNAMSARMMPIGSTFNKFRRVVRDLSSELGKDVELVAAGADTELDKTVIERLNDPLVHIIRNSLDHGIETPAERLAAGKPARGTVRLSASHSGANVVIEVADDGAGMNIEAIRAKAVERGIISAQDALGDAEAFMLIFQPGFSTAKTVTSVSGRGVGMDVVKREIDSLGGTVSVESTPGKGSSIALRIPLTLAIIDGLLVRISGERFVIPLSAVEACVEIDSAESASATRLLRYRGDLIPLVELRSFFSVPGEEPARRQAVVVNARDGRMGLGVDAVIGDYQTVIKPLGRMYRDAAGLSGATILGDGTVALIVDVLRVSDGASGRAEKARAS